MIGDGGLGDVGKYQRIVAAVGERIDRSAAVAALIGEGDIAVRADRIVDAVGRPTRVTGFGFAHQRFDRYVLAIGKADRVDAGVVRGILMERILQRHRTREAPKCCIRLHDADEVVAAAHPA
ncbi:hypothetical protein D9M68_886730 [compost metagenome]